MVVQLGVDMWVIRKRSRPGLTTFSFSSLPGMERVAGYGPDENAVESLPAMLPVRNMLDIGLGLCNVVWVNS